MIAKKRILIANRGEIALRIIRAAKELGFYTISIYSEADKESAHRFLADESICIGPADAKKSYLNIDTILNVAKLFNVDAIHPGYGFLAENSEFAQKCEKEGIIFIGPSTYHIQLMGDKKKAKETAQKAGVPVIPGTSIIKNTNFDKKQLKEIEKIGFPMIIKAVYGGGGRGMRIIDNNKELKKSIELSMEEAYKAFGDPSIYIEKYIENPKHIEVQILGDKKGNIVHLFERDCSIQRNHQKVIEEAPAPTLKPVDRFKIISNALKIVRTIKYYSAGTVEFLFDNKKNFYFIEMNTRIQVEHPITEEITDTDLLKNQILVAFDEEISFKQKDVKINGHSIEFRINAENVEYNFAPSSGLIEALFIPGGKGVRVDTHIYSGFYISEYYDPMIAKLIIKAKHREEALKKALIALDEFSIIGIDTNIGFLKKVIESPEFISGNYSTLFLKKFAFKS